MNPIVEELDRLHEKDAESIPPFEVGDTVDVHVRIVEGEKERIQVFSGTVIGRKGRGVNAYFTVRHLFA
ncbi:MAG: 50S ribosomal protein L19, partial [Planctomycetota bacterium]